MLISKLLRPRASITSDKGQYQSKLFTRRAAMRSNSVAQPAAAVAVSAMTTALLELADLRTGRSGSANISALITANAEPYAEEQSVVSTPAKPKTESGKRNRKVQCAVRLRRRGRAGRTAALETTRWSRVPQPLNLKIPLEFPKLAQLQFPACAGMSNELLGGRCTSKDLLCPTQESKYPAIGIKAVASHGAPVRFDRFEFSPKLIQARWTFGRLPSEEAPVLAQTALELGYDGKFTRRLAGELSPTFYDLQPLMPGFLSELGIQESLSKEQAANVLARFIAHAIVDGKVQPYVGASYIWREIVRDLYPNPPKELMPYVGNASDYEDCHYFVGCGSPDEIRREIEDGIVQYSRELLAMGCTDDAGDVSTK